MQGFYHLWTKLLLVQRRHTPKHQQQTRQNAKKKREKSTYQRIQSQNQVFQTHRQANLIRLATANIKAKDAIKIKKNGNERNRTRQTHHQTTMIRLEKAIIKARNTIKRRSIRKRNRTLSNYMQN